MKNEAGISLTELLVVLALAAIITLGASVTIVHTLRVSNQNREWGSVVHETGTAGYWIGHDLPMADPGLSSGDNNKTPENELLTLVWKDFQTGIVHYVDYVLVEQSNSLTQIERRFSTSENSTPAIIVVAEDVYQVEIVPNGTLWKLSIGTQAGSRRLSEEYDIYPRLNYASIVW